jgi:GMP synthase-like glutamine amidotransferase
MMGTAPLKKLKLNCIMHVPFEGPQAIADWAGRGGHEIRMTKLFAGDPLPRPEDFDILVVMGGPMSVHDEDRYAWLAGEKALVSECLRTGRFVLGVCLGSQIIAEQLGATVKRNRWKEIGWMPIKTAGTGGSLLGGLPDGATVFHWHGETFDLPPGSAHLASSEGCEVQAFEHASALGLQFHLEAGREGVEALVVNCAEDIGTGPYEQTVEQILEGEQRHGEEARLLMGRVMDRIGKRAAARAEAGHS